MNNVESLKITAVEYTKEHKRHKIMRTLLPIESEMCPISSELKCCPLVTSTVLGGRWMGSDWWEEVTRHRPLKLVTWLLIEAKISASLSKKPSALLLQGPSHCHGITTGMNWNIPRLSQDKSLCP